MTVLGHFENGHPDLKIGIFVKKKSTFRHVQNFHKNMTFLLIFTWFYLKDRYLRELHNKHNLSNKTIEIQTWSL